MSGSEVRKMRKSWGLKQIELAHLLGYNPRVMNDIERGRKPLPNMAERLMIRENILRDIKKLLVAIDIT
jgi:DNA-binding transcriptional regulator YiaG